MELIAIWLIAVLVVNGIFSWIVAYIAQQKGRSFGAFFALSFFLSFLVGILAVIAIPKREMPIGSSNSFFVTTSDGEKAKCPYCSEWVKADAKVCKHCGRDIYDELQNRRNQIEKDKIESQQKRYEEQLRLEAESAAKIEARNKRNKDFLQSKAGKITLISSGVLVVIAVVVASIQISTSLASQQIVNSQKAEEVALLEQDCELIYKRLVEFNSQTKQSSLSEGMQYGDHALLAQDSSRRALIQEEAQTIIPKLIPTDELFAGEYAELSFPQGVKVAAAVLYNQVVEGTSFEQIEDGEIKTFNSIPEDSFSLYEDCDSQTHDEMTDAYDSAKSWGEAVLVIRQCKLTGKLWDVACN